MARSGRADQAPGAREGVPQPYPRIPVSPGEIECTTWRDSEGVFHVEASRAVLEEIRAEAMRGLLGLGRGGIEKGGLLLGRRMGNLLRVTSWRPIACSHADGPSFVLSPDDEKALTRQIASAHRECAFSQLQLVGWFVSHTRRGLELSEEEQAFSERHFPEEWPVALVVKPSRVSESEVRVYSRRAVGAPLQARQPDMVLEQEPTPAARVKHSAVKPVPPGAPTTAPRAVLRPWLKCVIGVALCGGLAGSSLAAYRVLQQVRLPGSTAPLRLPSLRVVQSSPDLRVAWDADSEYVARASSAWLEVREAGGVKSIPLRREQLRGGTFSINVTGAEGSVTLAIRAGQQSPLFETVHWVSEIK